MPYCLFYCLCFDDTDFLFYFRFCDNLALFFTQPNGFGYAPLCVVG